MTTLFEWLPEYCIDHGLIDQQHKGIFQICAKLDAIRHAGSHNSAEQVRQLTLDLMIRSNEHFQYEESVCEQLNVPDLEMHREQHQTFKSMVSGVYVRSMQGKIDLDALISFLNEWFYSHITGTDMKLKDYLNAGTG